MVRLQQNIEELKTESGQDTDEEKVRFIYNIKHVLYLSFLKGREKTQIFWSAWILCVSTGEEPADRQTVQHRQRETAEDPPAHGNSFIQQTR